MHTYHIHITGIVQGVGFRPFVYKIANGLGLKGCIENGLDGVHFKFNADESLATNIYNKILKEAPSNARIYHHLLTRTKQVNFSTLEIRRSDETGDPDMPLTPDFALCPTCRAELISPENRRYQYPFTTCTYCGPRYSITQKLPYDRHTTIMDRFDMCLQCQKEYDNPADRRYYSQTNSCETCGIKLKFIDFTSAISDAAHTNKKIINKVAERLSQGKIIAVKGIGGYLLMCDAQNQQAIQTLRKRKHRPDKPFAVMYPNLERLNSEFKINASEKEALINEVGSIVLLHTSNGKNPSIQSDIIAPTLDRIGCMIPYAPLYQLILNKFKNPVVATSANISGSPIIYKNESAQQELNNIADSVLMHNRPILTPQDDSVISFTTLHNHKIIHRRSRGLAPSYHGANFKPTEHTILAVGAHMKSSFSLLTKNRVYISQYLGDMDNYLTQKAYQHTINHVQSILACKPNAIITDKHPTYFTTEWAKEKAQKLSIPVIQVQHHKAHFAAVLAENNLLESKEPILGVIWDGTGMGDDNHIWGGEFFVKQNKNFNRVEHIGYFPSILGDKMPKEPRISALCVCHSIVASKELIKSKFTKQEWVLYQKILANNEGKLSTSSMGRLFDAVASLLLNINKTSYEGEAAIQLENLAKSYRKSASPQIRNSYFYSAIKQPAHSTHYLISAIITDLKKGISPDKIAYYFHISLVDLIRIVATKNFTKSIAFSGGVFQNKLLTDMAISLLGKEYKLFFHKQLSPNDENISFGQLAYYMHNNKEESTL